MTRALTIIAAVAAPAASAAPVGSAHLQPADDGAGSAATNLTKAGPRKPPGAVGTRSRSGIFFDDGSGPYHR